MLWIATGSSIFAAIAVRLAKDGQILPVMAGNGLACSKDARRFGNIIFANQPQVAGDIDVRRAMARTAAVGCRRRAENGMVAVIADQRAAGLASLAQADNGTADLLRISVIPAAHILGEVPAHRCHIPEIRARY